MVSGTRALLKWVGIEVEGGSRAMALKRLITYAFTMRKFLLLLLFLVVKILAFGLRSRPQGWGFGLLG